MMTLQPVVGILSGVAALLFFGAGYLIASFLAAKKEIPVQNHLEKTETVTNQLKRELKQVVADRDSTRQELEKCQLRVTENEHENQTLHEQIKTLQTTIEGLEKQEFEANQSNQELIKVLESKDKELELLRHENRQLQEKNEFLNIQHRPLDLEPQALSFPEQPKPFEDMSSALKALLEYLSQNNRLDSVVFADKQGLLVAGSDKDSEAFAVVASRFEELAKKLSNLLHINKILQISVVDETDKTVAAQYFQVASSQLILLVSLTDGTVPDWLAVNQWLTEALTFLDKQ